MKATTRIRMKSIRWLLLALPAALALLLGLRPTFPVAAAFPGVNGKIAFVSDRDGNLNYEVYVMNADGSSQTNLTNHAAFDLDPAWSPNAIRIAFASNRDGNYEVYVMNADGSGQTNLTEDAANDDDPTWSPDGRQIAFTSYRDGGSEIYIMNADGSSQTRLTNRDVGARNPAWSPDGTKIAFERWMPGTSNWEIYVMNANGSGWLNLTNHSRHDTEANWSPDGTKITYTSDRDGNPEIYVMNADGSGQTRLTNHPGDEGLPSWSPDGSKIVFLSNQGGAIGELYLMNIDGSSQTRLTNNQAWDASPDWQRLPLTAGETTLLLSPTGGGTVGGVTFGEEDILRHDPSSGSWSLHFDGSDVGFNKAVAAFTLKGDGSFLLTPAANVNLAGVGTVTPWDVVRFVPSTGNFHWYFDGSDVGLTAAAEKIDALDVLPDGRVLVSTTGNLAVPKPSGGTLKSQDEDLTAFTFTGSPGSATTGTWALYFNGTAITGMSAEDVTGAAVDPATGDLYLALQNGFNVGGVSGGPKDILLLRPSGGGNYLVERFWRGPDNGFNFNLGGIEVNN